MPATTPKDEHRELLDAARAVIAARFREGYHHVGAAVRGRSGTVYAAVHLEATVGRVAVCAEAVALGMAAAAGDAEVGSVVAVDRAGRVLSPCGMCRELISDYSPEAEVIVPGERGPTTKPVNVLLPNKYRRNEQS